MIDTKTVIIGLLGCLIVCGMFTGCVGVNNQTSNASLESKTTVLKEESTVQEQEYKQGIRTKTEYISEWMELKYTLPESLVMLTDQETQQMLEKGVNLSYQKGKIPYTEELAYVTEMAGNSSNASIIIATEELPFTAINEEIYLIRSKLNYSSSAAMYEVEFGEIRKRMLADKEFMGLPFVLTIDREGYPVTSSWLILARKQANRMIAIHMRAQDSEQLDELLAGFSVI